MKSFRCVVLFSAAAVCLAAPPAGAAAETSAKPAAKTSPSHAGARKRPPSSASPEAVKSPAARRLGGILRMNEDVEIGPGDVIDGPVVVLRGDVRVSGKVDGPVVALRGSARVLPGGSVDGPVVSLGGASTAEAGSTVNGPLLEFPGAPIRWRRLGLLFSFLAGLAGSLWLAYKIVGTVGWVALAVLLAILFPRRLEATRAALENSPGLSALLGVLFWPALGAASAALLASIVGIPALPLLALGAACAWAWGFTAVSAYLGGKLVGGATPNAPLAVLAGAAVLRVAYWVPVVRFLPCLIVAVFGIGAAAAGMVSRSDGTPR